MKQSFIVLSIWRQCAQVYNFMFYMTLHY